MYPYAYMAFVDGNRCKVQSLVQGHIYFWGKGMYCKFFGKIAWYCNNKIAYVNNLLKAHLHIWHSAETNMVIFILFYTGSQWGTENFISASSKLLLKKISWQFFSKLQIKSLFNKTNIFVLCDTFYTSLLHNIVLYSKVETVFWIWILKTYYSFLWDITPKFFH